MSQQNYRHLSAEVLMDIKHSELPSENTLETPGTLNKRPTLESCQQLQNNKHDKRGIVAYQWVKRVVVY
jgi:uncharacterized phage-associated protein